MRRKNIIYVLVVVQVVMLCLWIRIALFMGEVYEGVRPVLEVGQKGVAENAALSMLVLDALKTKRFSQLRGYLTPRCRQKFGRFIEDWERIVHTFGEMRKVEHSDFVLMRSSEQDKSTIISKWQHRVRMEWGVAIVHCTLVYKHGKWQIETLIVHPESDVPVEQQ